MNEFRVIGNIVAKPELTETPSGVAMCKFSVAVKRDYTRGDGERGVDFFNCVCYRGVGENVARYCDKGSKIYLAGKIELRFYEDNQGIKRTAVDFIVDKTEFLPNGKKEETQTENEPTGDWTSPRRKKPTISPMEDDSEMPF